MNFSKKYLYDFFLFPPPTILHVLSCIQMSASSEAPHRSQSPLSAVKARRANQAQWERQHSQKQRMRREKESAAAISHGATLISAPLQQQQQRRQQQQQQHSEEKPRRKPPSRTNSTDREATIPPPSQFSRETPQQQQQQQQQQPQPHHRHRVASGGELLRNQDVGGVFEAGDVELEDDDEGGFVLAAEQVRNILTI